jgi:ABC-type polysaccharide/polyol phosphate transport system ATPase subunit
MKKNVIELINVSKSFTYWENKPNSIKTILTKISKLDFKKSHYRNIDVLDGVNVSIAEGEFVGIMGRNGVGKSTLLKIITGIYTPTKGEVKINGKIAPLLELGAGFAEELSGYENIFLNAAILGFSRKKMQDEIQKIIDFSELGDKIHMPVRNYSSGMLVRLGFAIASHLEASILLFDEILAVGDVGFQKKCLAKINELYAEGKSIILVTHSPDDVRRYCKRCIVFENKKVIFDGDPTEGTQVYLNEFK